MRLWWCPVQNYDLRSCIPILYKYCTMEGLITTTMPRVHGTYGSKKLWDLDMTEEKYNMLLIFHVDWFSIMLCSLQLRFLYVRKQSSLWHSYPGVWQIARTGKSCVETISMWLQRHCRSIDRTRLLTLRCEGRYQRAEEKICVLFFCVEFYNHDLYKQSCYFNSRFYKL